MAVNALGILDMYAECRASAILALVSARLIIRRLGKCMRILFYLLAILVVITWTVEALHHNTHNLTAAGIITALWVLTAPVINKSD